MEQLKQALLREGIVINEQVLNLDAVINQQVDPKLIMACGEQFAKLFRKERITKVLTIESSGISIAFATAYKLGVPLVFARRKKTLLSDNEAYCERVPSFTKGIVTDIVINRKFLAPEDRILLIDDMIANGDAIRGLIKIIEKSGATLAGIGIAIEKSFQAGARTLREQGFRVESLVRISSLEDGKIEING